MSTADAAAGEVLMLGSTLSGGAGSTLAQKFVAAGKTAVVVDDATWASMTTTQFEAYDALVLGDPSCGSALPSAAEANASVWSSAVDGNVIAIGSDETYHEGQGGEQLMTSAAAFTVAQAGKTGAYISLSCYYHDTAPNTPVPLLSGFGAFTMTGVGCYNDAHIVATHPALSGLTDADLSSWSCSVHEAFDSFPVSFEVLAIAQGIGTSYTATDGSVGTPYILARGVSVVSDIDLAPGSAARQVGQTHTLSATVTTDDPSPGTPVAGTTVTFTVIAGPNTGTTGTGTTNASGVASFPYTGSVVGEDTVEATFVDGLGRTQRSNRVTATWSAATNNAPSISSEPATVQYSDAVAPTVLASATDPEGDPLTMGSTALPAALSGSDNGSGGFLVSGTATAVPAAYPVTYSASDGTEPSTSSDDITITKEDCTLTAPATIQSSAGGNTTLTATMGESDSSLGDRSGKTISFSGSNVLGPVGPFTATTNGAGVVNASVLLAEGVYTFNASFAGDDYYNTCQTRSATTVTVVTETGQPSLSIKDVKVYENAGPAKFKVSLSGPSSSPVTVHYATAPLTASAGGDYSTTTGTLTIPAGKKSGTIQVPILDDNLDENNEYFTVALSAPAGATLSDAEAKGTIKDNDSAPQVKISGSRVLEGNAGTSSMDFKVRLTGPSGKIIKVTYTTADGTAVDDSDYISTRGTLIFAPGETSKIVRVAIKGDLAREPNETLRVNLSNPVHVAVSDGSGLGKIKNDD